MSVQHIPCGAPANASEVLAAERCVAALQELGDGGRWVVLSNLASSSSALHQSDELDLVCIGPRGVVLIEDKHWDAAWMRDHRVTVEAEAEKLTAKAKRLAGRVRSLLPGAAPKVEQWLLLTRDSGGTKLDPVRGVPVRTLKTLADAFRAMPVNVLTAVQVDTLTQGLEPRAKMQLDGRVRRLADYHNLELCSPRDDRFHRVYRGVHQRTKEKVVLHLYDLSATDEKDARRLAEREFRSIQLLQKCRAVPRFRDSFQDLPDYPGELCFFTLFDPEAPTLKRRAADTTWGHEQRVEFAARALEALRELHGLTDDNAVAIVHRSLSPETVLVAARNQPLFVGFHLARLPATQTVGTAALSAPSGPWVAPEVSHGGISAATQASDVFALCATLAALFEGRSTLLADDARNVLTTGLAAAPDQRPSLHELARQLRDLLPKAEGQPAQPGFHVPPPQPDCPPADYWCEGVEVPFRDMTLRVVTRLGSGGVGRTFKVEHVDARSGENYGTYVAKVIRTPEAGEAALRAYQRVRCHSVSPGLSAVFEVAPQWQPDRVVALLKWVEGESLDGLRGVLSLAAEECGEDSLESLLRRWLREVCSSLSVLHSQGLVHGDVSPRNLIHHQGGLTLTDYDLVTPAGQAAWGVGARSYCSPEAELRKALQPSDDLFALAASLFEVAFDHPPFPSPHGALDKSRGLDWRAGSKDSLGMLAEFFELATHPDRSRRFSDATAVLAWLDSKSVPTTQPVAAVQSAPEVTPLPARTEQVVPWLDFLLRSYPGSPHGSTETRGLDSEFASRTYVETPLENELFEALRSRGTRLVILCGNAGDGKTALLQKLAAKFGMTSVTSRSRIWEVRTEDGLLLRANLDGAAALQERGANDLLDELFAPFLNGPPVDDRAHLLAINDGRLLEWLQRRVETAGESPLTRALTAALASDDDPTTVPAHVRFISLNHRSLVGGRQANSEHVSTEFTDRLFDALLGGEKAAEIWAPCRACTAWERCNAGPTAHRLLAAKHAPNSTEGRRGRRMRERLTEAFQAVHQRGNIHITARDLRGVISYVLFGVKSCRDLHDNPGERAGLAGDMAFDPESPFRQGELLRELAELDPAMEAHPQLDRWLIGHSGREIAKAGPAYPDLKLPTARRRAFLEWTPEELEAVVGSRDALGLAAGQHLELFRMASLRDAAANAEVCHALCRGISQLENLPAPALRRAGMVPLRIPSRTPTETIFWAEKALKRFRVEPEWPPIQDDAIAVLPRRLRLIYNCIDGREEVLTMGYELFHTLLNLADG
jgi:serine/threonine protein kinase